MQYRINGKNFLMDQDAFNVVFGENVCFYPASVFPTYYELWMYKQRYFDKRKYNNLSRRYIMTNAIAIHYATTCKPWKYKQRHATRQYLKYWKHSPYRDIKLKPMSYAYQGYLIIWDKIYNLLVRTRLYEIVHKYKSRNKKNKFNN